MRCRAIAVLICLCTLAAAMLLSGSACENMGENLGRAAEIIEQHPGLIRDEEDRAKWVQGARTVRTLKGEVDTPQEVAMGQSLAVRAFVAFGEPYPDEAVQRYVAMVGKLVALQSERPTLPYSFAVFKSDRPNALALPGGFVLVSTGLLRMLGSESELACILGHEICHVAQKHGIEIVERDTKVRSLVDFGAALDEDVGEYRELIDQMYAKLTTEGYDQRYEEKADRAGARYAYRAGYHPEGLMPFLKADADSDRPLAFEAYKTHPDSRQRIRDLRDELEKLGDYAAMPKLEARYQRQVLAKLR